MDQSQKVSTVTCAIERRPHQSGCGHMDALQARGRLDAGGNLPAASVAVVVGTRPELIKVSEVLRLLGPAAVLVHTGQHYSDDMWSDVADDIGLPATVVQVGAVGGLRRSDQIGEGLRGLAATLRDSPSLEVVLVHGDTNATLAGALAANAERRHLVHLEAGLRSFDRAMPEEHNRVLVDHLADLCLAPTPTAERNLSSEGIDPSRIVLTGNTIVEVAHRLQGPAVDSRGICAKHGVTPGAYVLATLHRPENTDDPDQLKAILADLRALGAPVILPLHPRTRSRIASVDLDGLHVRPPLPPREFLALAQESALIVTDSGGLQEEVTVLGRPALVVRRSTERPETLGRWCELVQPGQRLRRLAEDRLDNTAKWTQRCAHPTPYGDGQASRRVVLAISTLLTAQEPVAA